MTELKQKSEMILALKSAILNIDWEISDETLEELNREIETLRGQWAGEKALLVYLQILAALSQYVGTSREKSHPGTFLLLKEAFESLEEVVLAPDMSLSEKNSRVLVFADRYNQLKKEIAASDFIPGPVKKQEDKKSTMDELLDDDGDHATDTVFDSMLNAMVKTPAEEDEGVEDEKPQPPPARPPVQVRFNKEDGTEVEPDRNEDDEFAEADELLDDFFDDDDIPAPGSDTASGEVVFDLGEEEDEAEVSDAQAEDVLVIDIDGETDSAEDDDSFQEMEETLDNFFGEDDDDDDLLSPAEDSEDDDVSLIDEALDDFFDDEPVSEPVTPDVPEVDSGAEEGDTAVLQLGDEDAPVEEQSASDIDDVDDELLINDQDVSEQDEDLLISDEDGDEDVLELAPEQEVDLEPEPEEELEVEPEVELEPESEEELEVEPEVTLEVEFDSDADLALDDSMDEGLEPSLDVQPEDKPEEEAESGSAVEPETEQTEESDADLGLEDLPEADDADEAADEDESALVDEPEIEDEPDIEIDPEAVLEVEPESEPVDGVRLVENLQALLLSVEWEVDDQLLLRLQDEIETLSVALNENRAAALHLNFLGAVIRYINQEQAEVISDSMICLKLLADSLEALLADETGDGVEYGAEAARSFVDWHELVILDFEKRVHPVEEEASLATSELEEPCDEPEPPVALSPEMEGLRQQIIGEVRELISQELSKPKS